MHINDAVFLEDLCPKFRFRQWRKSIHRFTDKSCIYCGKPSESIDHILPRSQGGLSVTEIVCQHVYHVMATNPTITLCIGIENKNFMIPEEPWQLELG